MHTNLREYNLKQSRLPPSLKLWRTSRPIAPFSYVGQGGKGAERGVRD